MELSNTQEFALQLIFAVGIFGGYYGLNLVKLLRKYKAYRLTKS